GPHTIAFAEESPRPRNNHVVFGKPVANLNSIVRKQTNIDLPNLDAIVTDHLDDGADLVIEQRRKRNGDTTTLPGDNRGTAEHADTQPFVVTNRDSSGTELSGGIHSRGNYSHMARNYAHADDFNLH